MLTLSDLVFTHIKEMESCKKTIDERNHTISKHFELAMGGQAQVHVGTGGGGSQSQLPWKDKDKRPARGTVSKWDICVWL